jgi:hypothetical protein
VLFLKRVEIFPIFPINCLSAVYINRAEYVPTNLCATLNVTATDTVRDVAGEFVVRHVISTKRMLRSAFIVDRRSVTRNSSSEIGYPLFVPPFAPLPSR